MAMRIGLLLVLSWVIGLTAPLFDIAGHPFSGRDIILIGGGLFLLAKATWEMPSKASRPEVLFNGIVLWAAGGIYRTLLDSGQEVEAALRGRLKLEQRTGDRVVAGDRVYVESHADGSHSIEAVAARKSEIARRAPGQGTRRAKVLVANVDQVAIVIAAASVMRSRRTVTS